MHTDKLILLARQHQFDEARRLILSLRAVNFDPGQAHDTQVFILLPCLIWCQTNTRRLWVGKGTPRDHTVVNFLLANGYERIAYRNSGLVGDK